MSEVRSEAIDLLRKAGLQSALRNELSILFFEERGWDMADRVVYNQATDQAHFPLSLGRIYERHEAKWICRRVAIWDHALGEWRAAS